MTDQPQRPVNLQDGKRLFNNLAESLKHFIDPEKATMSLDEAGAIVENELKHLFAAVVPAHDTDARTATHATA